MPYTFRNWAQTYSCQPKHYHEPSDLIELKTILHEAEFKDLVVRVVGQGHSPSDLVCTNDVIVSMKHFNQVLRYEKDGLVEVSTFESFRADT